jgi:hypothetical protein
MTVKEMEKPVGLHLTPAFLLSNRLPIWQGGKVSQSAVFCHPRNWAEVVHRPRPFFCNGSPPDCRSIDTKRFACT